MSAPGYYIHCEDMRYWLTQAQKALVVKNKIRKELWSELVDCIQWDPIDVSDRGDYFRLPQSAFVSIQTFCLTDGKGADTLSSDQVLNWCTTLADLRTRLALASETKRALRLGTSVSVSGPSGASALISEHKDAEMAEVEAEEEPVVHT